MIKKPWIVNTKEKAPLDISCLGSSNFLIRIIVSFNLYFVFIFDYTSVWLHFFYWQLDWKFIDPQNQIRNCLKRISYI